MTIINPNTLIEPGDGDMRKGLEDVENLEHEVTTQTFFDLMNYESKRFKNKRVVFRINEDTHNSMIKLQEAGIFRVNKKEMYKGLIGGGLLAMANQRKLCKLKVKAISMACKGSRVGSNIKKLDVALGCLYRNSITEKMLESNIKKHGDNAYGARLSLFLGKSEIVKGGSSKIVVQPHIVRRCKDSIAEIEANSIFYIKKEKGLENPMIDIKIPMPLTIVAFILKENLDTPKTLSEVYRAAFTIGLEILSNWIIQNRIPDEEYNFCKILHNIYDFATDNDA